MAEEPKTYFAEGKGEAQTGEWSYGICQCTRNVDWCCIGCFIPSVLLVRIGDHLKRIPQVKTILIILLLLVLFASIADTFENIEAHMENDLLKIIFGAVALIFALVALAILILYCVKVARLRGDIRERYGIAGSNCKDCCVVCCCVATIGLHNCQMYQEVAAREGMELA